MAAQVSRREGGDLPPTAQHVGWYHPAGKLFGRDVARGNWRLAQAQSLCVCAFGNFSRLVVADVRIQSGHQHQRLVQQRLDARTVGLNALGAVVVEAAHAVGQQANTLQKVVSHQWPEHVEFEVARGAADADGHIVAHHLRAQHGQRLALRRVDLARHDR